jgi:glycosyltransferase 1 domain-containing protein 1
MVDCGGDDTLIESTLHCSDSGDGEADSCPVLVALHAYRCHRWILAAGDKNRDARAKIRIVLVLGGTDVNENCADKRKLGVMQRCIDCAHCVVAFSDVMLENFVSRFLAPKTAQLCVVAPAVCVGAGASRGGAWLRASLGFDDDDVLVLLPCGLRPVKDPLMAIDGVGAERWRVGGGGGAKRRMRIVIIGPSLDADYARRVRLAAEQSGGTVACVDAVAPEQLLAAMAECAALLNTSRSEGLCNSILEAMALGVPVVARRNDGNCSVVEHRRNGLLFDTWPQCVDAIAELVESTTLARQLVAGAHKTIDERFSLGEERLSYRRLARLD